MSGTGTKRNCLGTQGIRHHAVVEDDCWFNGLYTRVVRSHAIELTAVFLDRNVAAILACTPNAKSGALGCQPDTHASLHPEFGTE
jgi:hypothetical protein